MGDDPVKAFEANRRRLLGLAYRLLGEATEAEDVLQDAYLRWMNSHDVEKPEAWLTTVVTNLCLNRLTSARARREAYIGPWLPEPVITGDGALGPLETVEQRDSVSFGVLVLLERLTPPERAVFVLREAFGHPHREIAEILGVDEAHSRQLHRRARERVAQDTKRFDADRQQQARIVQGLLAASADGDLDRLERMLADDVVAWSDGGGVGAARRPVIGRDKVARYLLGLSRRPEVAPTTPTLAEVNGSVGVAFHEGDELRAVVALEVADGRVTAFRLVVNPAKLGFAARQLA